MLEILLLALVVLSVITLAFIFVLGILVFSGTIAGLDLDEDDLEDQGK